MSWEDGVRRVVPYVPGEQPKQAGIIKLNTNECPYPPAPGVRRALDELDCGSMRLYPDPESGELVKALAEYYGLSERQVFVGVGSDDVLAMAFLTFFNTGKPILFPDITYSFYDVWADLFRIPYERLPLDEDFRIRTEDYADRECGGIVIANPNAPTGILLSLSEVERIVSANRDVVVIVDEAYIDFGGESALPLLEKYENLLVVQTCSKSRAMAGMRIGFAFGREKLIGYLSDCRFSFNSYPMNRPALAAGTAAIKEDAYFREICDKIIETRERVKGELKELGFSFADSRTNFVFAAHERVPAREIFEMLKEKGIYVRYFAKPRIDNHLRITIGTDEEMDRLIAVLREYLGKQ
ncbi:histidinol-phosphate transaminase [Lachnospiraceae bacterium 38-10]